MNKKNLFIVCRI